jgi:D-ribose pyranose/furanose isomerase RbsD
MSKAKELVEKYKVEEVIVDEGIPDSELKNLSQSIFKDIIAPGVGKDFIQMSLDVTKVLESKGIDKANPTARALVKEVLSTIGTDKKLEKIVFNNLKKV